MKYKKKHLKHSLCSRTFSWRTIQQLEKRLSRHYTRLCYCYCVERLVLIPLHLPTVLRLSKSVVSCLFTLA